MVTTTTTTTCAGYTLSISKEPSGRYVWHLMEGDAFIAHGAEECYSDARWEGWQAAIKRAAEVMDRLRAMSINTDPELSEEVTT